MEEAIVQFIIDKAVDNIVISCNFIIDFLMIYSPQECPLTIEGVR